MPLKAILNVIGSMAGSTDDRGKILKKKRTNWFGGANKTPPGRLTLVV
jgi:hypothetical protein